MERRLRANEEKYRTLVENISDIVFSTDENGILMYISPRINDMCGYTEYEMIGQKLTNYIHDEDRQRLIELIEKKQRSVHAEEFRLVTKSGDIKWVSWSSSPIITGTVFNGRRGIITDISMQMQAKKIVKKNERFLDAIFNSIQDGILVLDKDYTIIKVNQTMNAWYRHMIPLKGKRCFEAYHGRAEPCEICPTSKAFTSGKLEMDNIPLVTAKGQTGWLELFSFPMMDENGRVTGVVEYVKDITKRKQAEELIRMQRDLVQALSATSDLGEALSMSIDTAIRASGMDSGSVYLVNHKTGGADLAFHTGLGRHFIEKASHYHADSPFSRLVMSRKPVYNFNEELCLSPETFMVNEGIRAIAFIPIVSKDRVVACMNIASHIHDEIPVEFRNTLENIPMQIGGIITRLEIQESLKTSEEKFRLMIENSPYAIAIMDDADIISYINKTFTEVLGYTAEDIAAGEAWWDRAFPDVSYRKKIMGAGKKTAQKRGTRGIAASESQELTTICKDGSIKLIDYRVVSIGGNSFIFMNDLTEKMKTQEMMIHNEKMTSLGGLAAGMAHDINNPLSIILQGIQGILTRISKKNKINRDAAKRLGVNLDAMLAYMKKREIIEYLGGMNDAGQRAAKIVSNMLLFSRKSETNISPVDLNALIDKIVELASHDYDIKKKFDFRKITIKRFYDRNLPPVPCSETGIGQVIFNLLKNSSQAMSAVKVKAKEPVITIRT
jgi:PAS domain S-box-containing protein